MDVYLKAKSIVPAPNTYNISKDFIIKQNPLYSKSPRVMAADEIARKAKIYKQPDPMTYKP